MLISLQNLKEEKFYLKLDKKFVQSLLDSNSGVKPYRDVKLAKLLNNKFSQKYSEAAGIRGWYYYNKCIPMAKLKLLIENSLSYKWDDVENSLVGMKSSGFGFSRIIKPCFPISDDINLGLILGHIIGDGWIDTRFSQPGFSNTNKELLNEFILCMDKLFGVMPRIWVQKQRKFEEKSEWLKRVYSIEQIEDGYNATLFYPKSVGIILFNVFGKFINFRKKEIPTIAFRLSLEFKAGLIRALYDDEGSISVQSQSIRLHQDDSKLLEDVRRLLLDFDIKAARVRSYIKRGKYRHYFDVHSYENFIKFRKSIDFTSSIKKQKLMDLIGWLER